MVVKIKDNNVVISIVHKLFTGLQYPTEPAELPGGS